MQAYGLTLMERFLADLMTALGWLLMLFAVVAAVLSDPFGTARFAGGLLVALSFVSGAVLILGSSGIRQNRAAMEMAYGLLLACALGWLLRGVIGFTPAALGAGIVLGLVFGLLAYVRMLAIQARFHPSFLSLRQFETMIAIADTMIQAEGEEALSSIQVALNVDKALGLLDTPLKREIKLVMFIVEWLLPLRILRPFPFSALGTNERRRAVEKVIAARGLFRDVARFLKLLSCIGYYGTPQGMASVGYVPFEERERSLGADQIPLRFIEPLLVETRE
jgi:hypothetical protein